MKRFVKVVKRYQALTTSVKRSTLDVWQNFEYASFLSHLYLLV